MVPCSTPNVLPSSRCVTPMPYICRMLCTCKAVNLALLHRATFGLPPFRLSIRNVVKTRTFKEVGKSNACWVVTLVQCLRIRPLTCFKKPRHPMSSCVNTVNVHAPVLHRTGTSTSSKPTTSFKHRV